MPALGVRMQAWARSCKIVCMACLPACMNMHAGMQASKPVSNFACEPAYVAALGRTVRAHYGRPCLTPTLSRPAERYPAPKTGTSHAPPHSHPLLTGV
eukprot:177025-Chlamydomonas_euryale.AAC.1